MRYQVIGDAVPPPFARALGIGFHRFTHPLPDMFLDAPPQPPTTGSPLLRIYRVVRPAVLTPSADLAEAIVEVLGEDHSSTTVIASCGLHDLSDTSIFNGLHGTATVFRGDTLLHVTATSAAWALSRGYTHLVVFGKLDHSEFFTYLTVADSSSALLDVVVAFGALNGLSYVIARLANSLASTSTVIALMMLKSARR